MKRPMSIIAAGLAGLLLATIAWSRQWDITAGDYHTHLIDRGGRFELHLHDRATHRAIDTSRGVFKATMLTGGRPVEVPLRSLQAGILGGERALQGEWTLLFKVEIPGRKPAQVRYSSKMKPGAQDGAKADKGHDHDGHSHGDGHKHDH